ncbi:MAG: glycerol-3-phosphate 1-O-acyltransferase PlsY [Alphaproteobacteria bacterium]|jgi:glycerol-3-phosphate acyltransferase PlsY|nr:glycerol-3-phosphate 1-O-acyltransferase PlsY [Alphaproteobacteria bacterium]
MESDYLMIVIVMSYVLGSLPYGYILVKMFKGVDIRTVGSGNIGTTNVLRAGYRGLAFLTLLLDSFKGAIAILLTRHYFNLDEDYVAIAGLVAILGHMYPIWLKFKGGKGVATFFGTILAFDPLLFLICGFVWLLIAIPTRYSSLAAIVSVIVFPVAAYFLDEPLFYVSIAIAVLIIYKHRENIKRLLQGKESKIKFKK